MGPAALRQFLLAENANALQTPTFFYVPQGEVEARNLISTLQTTRQSLNGLPRLDQATRAGIRDVVIAFVRSGCCSRYDLLAAERYLLRLSHQVHANVRPAALVASC